MTVLQHQPLPSADRVLQQIDRRRLLPLSQREILEILNAAPESIGQFHQFRRGIRTGAQDEDDRRHGGALVEDIIETDHRWHDVLLAHDLGDVIAHSSKDPIYSEASQQHQYLERAQLVSVVAGKVYGFRSVQIIPYDYLVGIILKGSVRAFVQNGKKYS